MQRSIEILIDSKTWEDSGNLVVPIEIAQMQGHWQANVLHALIYTALWTRPPVSHGFHLSDFWAWFRYYVAISDSSDLRLHKEWNTIDPHQKAVLSDELAVGFTTHLLIEKLGCEWFVDTLYLTKTLPTKFSLNRSKRLKDSKGIGKHKSPDYIGHNIKGEYYVLECKGTQTSRGALQKAITAGKAQKNNLVCGTGTKIKYSLVAGLFIPQFKSREKSCINIADPTWDELEELLNEYDSEDINTGILQIALAKHFSLIGLTNLARTLAETPTDSIELSDVTRREINDWLEIQPESRFRTIFDTQSIYSRSRTTESGFPRGRFLVDTPDSFLVQLRDSTSVGERLRELSRSFLHPNLINREIDFEQVESSPNEVSSLGFRFRLEIF